MHRFLLRYPRHLPARLLGAVAAVNAAVLALALVGLLWRMEQVTQSVRRSDLVHTVALLAESVAEPLEERDLIRMQRVLERTLAFGFRSALVMDARGRVILEVVAPMEPGHPAAGPSAQMDSAVTVMGRRIGSVRLTLSDRAGVWDSTDVLWFVAWVSGSLLTGTLLLGWVVGVTAHRLSRLRAAAVAAAGGDLAVRIPRFRPGDVDDLGRALDTLVTLAHQGREEAGGMPALFRHFADLHPLALIVIRDGRPLYVNQAAAELFEADRPEQLMTRRSVRELFDTWQQERLDALLHGDGPSGTGLVRCGLRIVTLSGQRRPVDCAVSTLPWDDAPALQLVLVDVSTRSQEERSLQEVTASFRAIASAAPSALYVARKEDGQLLFANQSVPELFRLEGDPLQYSALDFYWDPADRNWVLSQFDHLGRLTALQVRFRRGQEMFWGLVSSVEQPFQGIPALYTSVLDITSRVRAEQALADSEARHRALVELIPDGLCVTRDDAIIFVNEAAVRILNAQTKADLLGRDVLAVVHPASEASVRQQMEQARRSAGTTAIAQERFVDISGAALNVEVRVSRIQFEGDRATLVVFRDVTRQKQAEEALSRSEQMLRTVIQNAPLVLYALDAEGRFLLSEGRELAVLGRRPGEVVGQSAFEVFSRFPDRIALLERALAGESFSAQIVIDGVRFDAYHQPLFDDDGQPNGAIVVSVNTTERDLAEAQLRQAQKMEAVGQLTGGVAHDFNNLLTVVLGNLELLRRTSGGNPGALEIIDQATEAAERGSQLTQRLLAFSRKQALRPAPVDVNRLVTGMADLLRPMLGETIELETVLAGGLWPALVDANQLESALLNLALNARDAMPAGGKLTIETANARLDVEYAAMHEEVKAGQYVMIAVSDTGEGMTPEVMQRVFEPFFTTKEVGRGSGLGLSMIFGFVKQSAGHIKLYSEPGQGTTVKVYLPRAAQPAETRRATGHSLAGLQGTGQKVLVVEDEESVRELAIAILTSLGYVTLAAEDGPSALALLQANPDVALLFTDVVLPGGMSGADLARVAQSRQPGLKVLFTSGYTENAIIHHGRLDDHVELLEKPFRVETLARKVRSMLGGDNE